ncbi:MAG: hypothetical protein Q7V53_02845 [Caldisericota bacterium]|nr:hypothetical protein [Caldisericota bacterium]
MSLDHHAYVDNQCMAWEALSPPYFWRAAGMSVTHDRHLPDGTRQHAVGGPAAPDLVIGNAMVVPAFTLAG